MKQTPTPSSGKTKKALERLQQTFRRSRPGSVLIMVVALLVLLALMGTAYLATARQDRLAAGLMTDNGLDAAVKQAANNALANALTWLSGDNQTFTSSGVPDAGATATPASASLSGTIFASRAPDVFSNLGPTNVVPTVNGSSNKIVVRWPRLTIPQGYSQFASPILATGPNGGNNTNNQPQAYYDLNAQYASQEAQFWAAPTSLTLTYPASNYLGNSDLAGQTRTFPALKKVNFYNARNIAGAASFSESGPYLAADTTGSGIADAALVQLDVPSVDGVQFFAGWRIIDNAAALNLNTAWGPNPYFSATGDAGGTDSTSNRDSNKNAYNFFPTDVNLYGLLNSAFNQNDTVLQGEMPTLQSRRAFSSNADYTRSFFTDNPTAAARTDLAYLYRGEAMWWHLGRRLDDPINLAGDPKDGYRRPFDDVDTIALGTNGVMTDPAAPSSKIEQLFNNLSSNPSDSIYRLAVNYMLNPENRFNTFPANTMGYWYDWNYNFGLGNPFAPIATSTTKGPVAVGSVFYGNGVDDQTTKMTVNTTFGYGAGTGSNTLEPWRNPRPVLVGRNPVANVARYVDPASWPDSTQTAVAPAVTTTPGITPMATLGATHSKVSLNTGSFEALWRSFGNVFNDFNPEDGISAASGPNGTYVLRIMCDALGYDIRDTNGVNANPTQPITQPDLTKPYANPRQIRNTLRDPGDFESYSLGTTSSANGTSAAKPQYWFDSRNMAALRAALAAINVVTLRDQHGSMFDTANRYFAPDVSKAVIQLKRSLAPPSAAPNSAAISVTQEVVNTYVYGVGAQPYITEVYVNTDTSDHPQPGGGAAQKNPNGLIVIKLYNPYPFPLPLSGYDIALIDRSGFTTGAMTATLVSRASGTRGQLLKLGTPPATPASVPAEGYILLTNFDPASGYWPVYTTFSTGWPTTPPDSASLTTIFIPGLSDALGGTTPAGVGAAANANNGSELVLLRPLAADAANATGRTPGSKLANLDTITPQVPVDSFDFSGLLAPPTASGGKAKFRVWHYLRLSGKSTLNATVDGKTVAWRHVFPGPYSGSGAFATVPMAAATNGYNGPKPHFFNTDVGSWDTGANEKDPWSSDPNDPNSPSTTASTLVPKLHFVVTAGDSPDSTYINYFPGIQLCNIGFGGFNKRDPAKKAEFPYGGFARVGDVQQAPFIGSYIVLPPSTTASAAWPPDVPSASNAAPGSAVKVAEINPVTIDSAYADDGDVTDDAFEQVGRFTPLIDPTFTDGSLKINDFWPSGYYQVGHQDGSGNNLPPIAGKNNTLYPYQDLVPALWRYHFANEVFNQFTTIANPGSDYFPNLHPDSWYPAPTVADQPFLVPSTSNGIEGLININTADWRTLATVEMIPRAFDDSGSLNLQLAKAIVYYRDVDDGHIHVKRNGVSNNPNWVFDGKTGLFTPNSSAQPSRYARGHGPFNNLAELNDVIDYSSGPASTNGFRNAMGALSLAGVSNTTSRHNWGYYTPGGPNFVGAKDDDTIQSTDWLVYNLMSERVSNLFTTRSDSFTIYLVVQGWRNAFQPLTPAVITPTPATPKAGPWPELVVQKRVAVTVDRSAVNALTKSVSTSAFPTK